MASSNSKKTVKILIVLLLFAAAAVFSVIFMNRVAINYDLADYLGKDTQTKTALNVIEKEFGKTGSIQVMAGDVSASEADEIKEKIKAVPNVKSVSFDKYSETYYKDRHALFVVIVDGDDYSQNAKQVAADLRTVLAGYEGIEYGGTTVEKQALQDAITGEMVWILALSLCLVVAILLITSESFLEPFVLLAASGVAVLLNRGTNFFFGEISYITNSIAAILQLALSIDYSIVLLHTYRREKEKEKDNRCAMADAIRAVTKPVSASALTTIAGLLALLFMSFRIGFDIGIVLMKGIVISAVTSLTLLPALVLLCDKLMKKTRKKAFVPQGALFCRIAGRAGKVIVPVALVLVILCGVLQSANRYLFTDTKSGNAAITGIFGNNNTVVVVYPNSENNEENEKKLAEALAAYRTADGRSVLSNHTAYSNTVREAYDLQKAMQKLDLSEKDAELLLILYNLYREPGDLRMSFSEFTDFAARLLREDEDAADFADADTVKTLEIMNLVKEVMANDHSAEELHTQLTTGVMEGTDLRLFSVRQLYGLYFYGDVADPSVDFLTMINYMAAASSNENLAGMISAQTVSDLRTLALGIRLFNAQMEANTTQSTFKSKMESAYQVTLSEEEVGAIYAGYFSATSQPVAETAPYLPLLTFAVQSGAVNSEAAVTDARQKNALYVHVHGAYRYDEFLQAVAVTAQALSGKTPEINATDESVQQIYILYFYENERMPAGRINGRTFVRFALETDASNTVVHESLSQENREKLADMLTVDGYMTDDTGLSYPEIYKKLTALKSEIKSDLSATDLSADKVSGIFVKYAAGKDTALLAPVRACDLLDFVRSNMDTNALLLKKMTAENRQKVEDSQRDMEKAEDLFLGTNYSRMLLSVNLSNESEETTAFVEYLSGKAKEVFGQEASITGEIVSTYDLRKSFDRDNLFITVFTLISIFLIVMLIFRSLSLPMILVAVIQGAIFMAMSTQLLGHGIFFMSYIVSSCILMGATIDYGILMSSNYVAYRGVYDREEALRRSVAAAMPTVFSSGLILIVCGFVIHFVSSQNSISTVGLLLGIGTLCSVLMISLVLPCVLYLLDAFVLKLSLKKKPEEK